MDSDLRFRFTRRCNKVIHTVWTYTVWTLPRVWIMDALEVPWNPGLNVLAGKCIVLILIPYGNMVDEFSYFIVSLYVSDLPTVTMYRYCTPYVVFRAFNPCTVRVFINFIHFFYFCSGPVWTVPALYKRRPQPASYARSIFIQGLGEQKRTKFKINGRTKNTPVASYHLRYGTVPYCPARSAPPPLQRPSC